MDAEFSDLIWKVLENLDRRGFKMHKVPCPQRFAIGQGHVAWNHGGSFVPADGGATPCLPGAEV